MIILVASAAEAGTADEVLKSVVAAATEKFVDEIMKSVSAAGP